jgi:hypothetical protein
LVFDARQVNVAHALMRAAFHTRVNA